MIDVKFPAVMGILNVTPDSFSDGGRFLDRERALEHARRMIGEGADIVDIGGESTRPGADAVSIGEELDRTIPVIEALRAETHVPISIDTSRPEVMREAAAAGASMINDVRALRRDGALEAVSQTGLPVCLMHMQGEPATMQQNPRYDDLIEDIRSFFLERIADCVDAGIPEDHLWIDPGFGFGKTPDQNLRLINQLGSFCSLGRPVLVGLSRKSTIGKILGMDADRLHGSVAGALAAIDNGAAVVRVHDVGPTVQALKVVQAIRIESTE